MAGQVWYTARNGQQQGPFTEEVLRQSAANGELLASDLVWTQGMEQWRPASEILELGGQAAAGEMPVIATATQRAGAGQAKVAVALGYEPVMAVPYAGFWLRVAAALIDGILMNVAGVIMVMSVGLLAGVGVVFEAEKLPPGINAVVQLVTVIMQWLYYALMECSQKQATIGKMAVGIRVTDMRGGRIGFGKATGRYFGKIISAIILCIGFMMAGWTQKKQALHDMMAGTLVVRK